MATVHQIGKLHVSTSCFYSKDLPKKKAMQILEISRTSPENLENSTLNCSFFLVARWLPRLQAPTVHRSLAGFETFQGTFWSWGDFRGPTWESVWPTRSSGLVVVTPFEQIYSSNWIISQFVGGKMKKYLKPPPSHSFFVCFWHKMVPLVDLLKNANLLLVLLIFL